MYTLTFHIMVTLIGVPSVVLAAKPGYVAFRLVTATGAVGKNNKLASGYMHLLSNLMNLGPNARSYLGPLRPPGINVKP